MGGGSRRSNYAVWWANIKRLAGQETDPSGVQYGCEKHYSAAAV
jgi:hypothetical protein